MEAGPWRGAAAAAALLVSLGWAASKAYRPPFPDPSGIRVPRGEAIQNGALLSLGMRRLAADLSFIRLLMYYGTPEEREEDDHAHPHGVAHQWGSGHYPDMLPLATRIIELDPAFTFVPVYAAGALAFNLDRPDEAMSMLTRASGLLPPDDPVQWKYRVLVAGIGFHKKGDAERVLAEVSPILGDPNCPTLIKNMMAFLNRRLGRRDEAVRLYREILRSKDASYRHIAERALKELGA